MQEDVAIDDPIVDAPAKNTKSFVEVYERCNMVVVEPTNFVEALKYQE